MKVTVAKWYTPKDYGIDKVGINPDIEVKFEKEDFEKKYDRQLEESKKILESFILSKKDKKAFVEEYLKNKLDSAIKVISTGSGSTKK